MTCHSPAKFRGLCPQTGYLRWETRHAAKQFGRRLAKSRDDDRVHFRARRCAYCRDWHARSCYPVAEVEVQAC